MADITGMLQAAAGNAGEDVDPDFANTVLLLHGDGTNGAQNNTFLDSSTNNFTITRAGNTTQGSFSPFSKPDGRWGNYFDGSGDYLTSTWDTIGANQFTCEAWVYITEGSARKQIIGPGTDTNTHYDGFGFEIQGQTLNMWASSDGTGWNLVTSDTSQGQSANSVPLNSWVHVVMTRDSSGVFRSFINGNLECVVSPGTAALADASTTVLNIGRSRYLGDFANYLGYISSLRVVNGSVVSAYSTASTTVDTQIFTPPTTPLTAISGTSLLTCQSNRFIDNSANAFAITAAGNVKVTPFSPFPITTEYTPSVNGGSGYFDGGSTGRITMPSDSAFAFGTGSYTLEAWVYINARNSFDSIVFDSGSATNSLGFTIGNTGAVVLAKYGVGRIFASSANAVGLNEFAHVAIVRSSTASNDTKMYVNGALVATSTDNNNWTVTTTPSIGGIGLTNHTMNGFIASFRAVKGTAVYTSAFTPPTAPLTAITNTSLLCNFTNAGIFDNTAFNNLETVGNAQIDTTTKKYGTGSLEFDGTGDELVTPYNPALALGGGDFTLECWIYPITNNFYNGIYQNYTDGNGRATALRINTNNTDQTSLMVQTQASALITTSTGVVTANAWNHIALVRNGSGSNNLVLYVNGTSAGTATNTTNFSDGIAQIGNARYAGSNYYFNGLIDDLRLTVGVARYTTTFTPPDKAFPNIGS